MSVAKSSFLFTAGTVVSRITGVLRESVVGAVFGANNVMDAFIVAYRIPNLLRDMLAEGALGSSFTRVYSAVAVEDPKRAQKVFIDALHIVTLIGVIVSGLGMLFAPQLVDLMTSPDMASRGPEFLQTTTRLTQLLFPTVLFLSLGAIVTGTLHQRGLFFLSAMSPVAFNVANIIGALWFSGLLIHHGPTWFNEFFGDAGIAGLALGVLLGSVLQLGLATSGIWKDLLKGQLTAPRQFPWSPELRRVFMLMGPMVIGASAGQINAVVNTNFATSLQPGAVTWLNFAFRFLQLPIGMFGVAISAAVLPALVKSITAAGKRVDRQASQEIVNALDLVVWLTVPCLVFLHQTSLPVIELFYQAGRFTAADATATAVALHAYSYGLIGYGMIKVMNSYYYAVDRTRFAMYVSLLSIAVNYFGNLLLVRSHGHEGLAYTASITLSLNALLLAAGMRQDKVEIPWREFVRSLGFLGLAALLGLLLQSFALPLSSVVDGFLQAIAMNPTVAIKVRASSQILVNGLVVAGIFGTLGLLRLRESPGSVLARIKRLRRSRR